MILVTSDPGPLLHHARSRRPMGQDQVPPCVQPRMAAMAARSPLSLFHHGLVPGPASKWLQEQRLWLEQVLEEEQARLHPASPRPPSSHLQQLPPFELASLVVAAGAQQLWPPEHLRLQMPGRQQTRPMGP